MLRPASCRKEEQEKTNGFLQKEVDACVDRHKMTERDVKEQRRAMDNAVARRRGRRTREETRGSLLFAQMSKEVELGKAKKNVGRA